MCASSCPSCKGVWENKYPSYSAFVVEPRWSSPNREEHFNVGSHRSWQVSPTKTSRLSNQHVRDHGCTRDDSDTGWWSQSVWSMRGDVSQHVMPCLVQFSNYRYLEAGIERERAREREVAASQLLQNYERHCRYNCMEITPIFKKNCNPRTWLVDIRLINVIFCGTSFVQVLRKLESGE